MELLRWIICWNPTILRSKKKREEISIETLKSETEEGVKRGEITELKEKVNVLYSPTFRNDNRNGFEELIKYFDFENYNLVITFHPKVADFKNDERVIKINPSEISTYDIVKICDYVITDYSSLMIDALIANKKILLYVYDYDKYKKENGLNIDLINEFPNITKKNAKEII